MTAPANWPTDRLVYPQEAWRLAAEGSHIRGAGGYQPAARVVVRDANGRRLAGVIACCEATGQVISARMRNGEFVTGPNGVEEITEFLPAPLQITYEVAEPQPSEA
jgi:hypothetical protein